MAGTEAEPVIKSARRAVAEFGSALVSIRLDAREGRVEVLPCERAISLPTNGANGSNGSAGARPLSSTPRISA
jgi:hypothetical protein